MQSLFGDDRARRVATQKPRSVLVYSNLSRGSWPGRGLLYSSLIHEVVIFGLLFASASQPLPEHARLLEMARIINLSQPKEVLYLPPLGGGHEGNGEGGGRPAVPRKGSPGARSAARKGFSYPGPQVIISNPPKPTNRIQTVLQPGLVNPPSLRVPIALPNVVQMAEAGPAPIVEPLKAPPPVAVEAQPSSPPSVQPQAEKPAQVLPILPKVEPLATAPAEPPKLELPAATFTPQNPPLVAQANPPEPPAKPVEKPVESPAPQQSAPLPTHGTDQQNLLALSPMPAPPEHSVELPAGEARGQFAISPEPNTQSSTSGPGSQVEKPDSSAIGVGTQAGASAGNAPAAVGPGMGKGVGNGPGEAGGSGAGVGEGKGSGGRGSGTGGTGAGEGKGSSNGVGSGNGSGVGVGGGSEVGSGRGAGDGTGTGTGAGAGPGAGAFPGITIQGGSLTGRQSNPGQPTATPVAPQTSYALTIVASGSSGGGLPDLGVFFDEQVYTVYVNMKQTNDDPAPSWVLEYAVLRKAAAQRGTENKLGQNQQGLVPPFPVVKETPQFPVELLSRYLHRMLIVYAIINTEGKFERMHVMQTPNTEFNQPLLEALGKWVFRPAELNGQAVSLKALLGVPLSLPE